LGEKQITFAPQKANIIERIHFNTTIKVQYSNAQYCLTICTEKYHMCSRHL